MKEKVVAIIPIKKHSKRVKKKNFIKINNVPLYEILLKKIIKCNFDEVYVDTDSDIIKKFCIKNNIIPIHRLPHLASDNANGNDLLNYHKKIIKADYYFQIFITAPLMSIRTINQCIKILIKSKNYDSILTSKSIYSWFWFKKKPINYKPKILPRSQDAQPVVVETTGLYGIKKKALQKLKCRIGKRPYFFEVPDKESLDLDNKKDFEYLKYFVKK
tara:strand:+ start:3098 stop:3745 length:648 start_codon:yes stop_codon:yes gene_type:complete